MFDTCFTGAVTCRVPVGEGTHGFRLSCAAGGAGSNLARIFASGMSAVFLPEQ